MNDSINIIDVSKSYQEKNLFKGLNLNINRGELISIFGPNGCGKTTLLNLIAGIASPDLGKIDIFGKQPKDVIFGYVFQNYRDSLLPWRTNLENICFPLELRGVKKIEREAKALEAIKRFALPIPLHQYPYQSSGGEQQLVAMFRELISGAEIILMDEPFSALSYQSRIYFKQKLQELWKQLDVTIIFVSHDINETIQLGDRVLLLGHDYRGKPIEIINTLPRPRSESTLYTDDYRNIYEKIWNSYKTVAPLV